MHKILIVDDEDAIRIAIKEYAEFMSYEVEEACDGMDALELCKNNDYDLIVMDVMMPKLDGFTACKEIKKIKNIPILMLSARSEEYDKLFGFEIGIDDYVTKPFSIKEILARINAIISRNKNISKEQDIYIFDGIKIDVAARDIFVDNIKIDLTLKEYDLLLFMIKNKNIALTREKLLTGVWGYDYYGDDRTVDSHIKTLRSRLGKYKEFVVTLRGVGYKFEA